MVNGLKKYGASAVKVQCRHSPFNHGNARGDRYTAPQSHAVPGKVQTPGIALCQ